ncbi:MULTISPECIES: TnsA-like heteromeric transposase endonuclease subunit [unclassified Streptomyces]|uniref:TnsA-like heteromeric transposase endonuclease subunit n=1 Tax=unclassified Streptomyces TaxID=2593676 RepID=UPI0037F8BF37
MVDVRPDDRIELDDAEAFAATERVCDPAGWSFERVGMIRPALLANVRWSRGYGHSRCWRQETAGRLLEAFNVPRPLFAGAEAVGDRVAVLPVLYHLLWRGALVTEMESQVMGPTGRPKPRELAPGTARPPTGNLPTRQGPAQGRAPRVRSRPGGRACSKALCAWLRRRGIAHARDRLPVRGNLSVLRSGRRPAPLRASA